MRCMNMHHGRAPINCIRQLASNLYCPRAKAPRPQAKSSAMTTAATTPGSIAPDAGADALVASFERAGYARVQPAILQPAEPFLDLSGEDIRKRMFLTADPQGHELCLRPDLTIPVSRDYLASPAAGKTAGFCYLGPVFRHRKSNVSDFRHLEEGEVGNTRLRRAEEASEF